MIDIKEYLNYTESGRPCIWEQGGNGFSIVVASDKGYALKPFAAKKPAPVNGEHALIPLKDGYYIVVVEGNKTTVVRTILNGDEFTFDRVRTGWPKALDIAIKCAKKKASGDSDRAIYTTEAFSRFRNYGIKQW